MFSKIFRRSKPDRSENASGSNSSSSNAVGGKNSKKKTHKDNSNPSIGKLSTLENSWRWSRADAATNVILNKALVVEDQIVRRMDDLKKSNNHCNAAVVGTVPMVADRSVRANEHHATDATKENSVEFSPYRKEKSSRNEFVDVTRDGRVAAVSSSSYRNSSNRKQNDQLRSESNPNDKATANQRKRYESHLLLQQESQPSPSRNASIPVSDQTASNSFNPINKSRAFFYEIMGKNRNRNRNRNRNKDTKPYERVDSSITTVATVAAAATNVCVQSPTSQDQANVLKSNEQPNKQLEECTKSAASATKIDRVSNINKFLKDKNNFENFGYQITKSKNRQNLVMNYEGEIRQDDGIEDDAGNNEWQNFPKTCGSGSPNVNVEASAPPVVVVCADASLDANRYFKHEPGSQSNNNSYNNVGSSNGNNEVIIIGDLNLHGEQIETDPHHNESDYSRHQSDNHQPNGRLDRDVVVVAAKTAQLVAGHSTLKRNFENDRLQIDDLDADAEQQLSELTECDRDRRQDQILIDAISMGQDSSKNSAAGRHTNQSWRPSDHVQSANIVIPTITVADYSDDSFKATDKTPNNSPGNATLDNDIFYDTENFDSDTGGGSAAATANTPSECWGGLTIDSAADNDSKFVSCESDDVIIEDDPDFIADIPTTVINSGRIPRDDSGIDYRSGRGSLSSDNFRNTSNSSIFNESGSGKKRSGSNGSIRASASSSSASSGDSCGKHHTDSPDSGIELLDDNSRNYTSISSEHLLRTAGAAGGTDSEGFVRGGSTDCDENFLFPSDNEDPEQLHHQTRPHHQEYQQYHMQHDNDHNRSIYENPYSKDKAILIDSISLPDVVVESTSGMGNSQSIKTVEHIEDHKNATTILTDHNDNNTRDLVNQEARYSAQLEEAQKIIFSTQAKVNELQSKIDSLEQELSIKSWNVDRLQGELQAANTEDACVRSRLTILQAEIVNLKQKYSESEYELSCRYEELQTKHKELLENYRHTQNFANALQSQLAFANSDIENLRLEKRKLCEEKDDELRKLQEALRKSEEKHKELEEKWLKEFEMLRTQNADREEHLMADCEWQLRAMQKTCKDKIDVAVREKNKALEQANEISTRASEQLEQVTHLIPLEAEIKQLRGLTSEQNESLISMSDQMENLRSDLEVANQQLEEEIKNVRKIRMHCENSLSDKDRQMVQKIEEARGEVAVEWERRLMEEMSRLKHELELVHADDRRDALDKLQVEHIEEIKALTCRFDANEEELRIEVAQLRAALQEKTEILNEIEERSSARLLETRLHLERADSEYQIAMTRQNQMREELMEQLQSEFAQERTNMEEKFRERLNQVKDEFAKELANTTDELKKQHRKQLEKQWEKLIAEKEDALQTMETRHRIRHEEAENRIKELEIEHHRDMKEMKTNFEIERTTLESRDLQNSQEIEQLHRKCRCLTNLFEEMRMRYERREPRPEDLREIAELRERCESQERDLHALTERLREIQIERENEMVALQDQRKSKIVTSTASVTRKPPPKTIPTNCDVIYEENEERESPHKENNGIIDTIKDEEDNDDDDDENGEDSAGNNSDEDEEEDDEADEDDEDRSEENDRPDFQKCKRFEINEAIAAES